MKVRIELSEFPNGITAHFDGLDSLTREITVAEPHKVLTDKNAFDLVFKNALPKVIWSDIEKIRGLSE